MLSYKHIAANTRTYCSYITTIHINKLLQLKFLKSSMNDYCIIKIYIIQKYTSWKERSFVFAVIGLHILFLFGQNIMGRKIEKAENRWLQGFMISELFWVRKYKRVKSMKNEKINISSSAQWSPAGLTNTYEQHSEAVRFEISAI
jgi:hypothetical protein